MLFVTGASGFIGRYVVKELLNQKQEVLCLVRDAEKYQLIDNEQIVEGCLGDLEQLEPVLNDKQIDTCIHLAWEGIPDYSYEMSCRNLDHSLKLLKVCKNIGVSNLVITGSCWEYENPVGCIKTDYPVSSANAFKAAKNSLHMMAHAFCKEHEIHLNWMRLFYVYGPGQREGSLIPYIIHSFKNGKKPELNGAYNQNDFVYVQDVAEAIVKVALNHSYPEVLNVGSGEATRVMDIVMEGAKQFNIQISENDYERNSGTNFFADKEEKEKDYGWSRTSSITEGISAMIAES